MAVTGERMRMQRGVLREPVLVLTAAVLVAIAAMLIAVGETRGIPRSQLAVIAIAAMMMAAVGIGGMLLLMRRQRQEGREFGLWGAVGEALPFPCCVVDGKGRAQFANRRFLTLFPDSSHAPLAHLKRRIGDDAAASERIGRLLAAAQSGVPATDEMMARNGEWYRISALPLSDSANCVLWVVEDISERHRMEQTIREEQEKLVDFLENTPIGFYSVDQDGNFLLINRTLATWLGYEPEEFTRQKMRLHDILAVPPAYTPPYRAVAAGPDGNSDGAEVGLRTRDNDILQVYIGQTEIRTESGEIRTRSVVRDLTPEHEWEQALKRSEQRFARFFEDAPVGIVLLDAEARVTESNRAWRGLVATADQKLAGRKIIDFVVDDDVPKVMTWFDRVIADPGLTSPVDVMLRTTTDAGHHRIATMYVSRMDDGRGGVYGLIVHFLETTEQRNLEAQFAQGQKMQAVGQLAGGVAHDFNNLLTAMIGFCDLLLLRHSPGDQSFGDIMQIKQNASRAARLVRQLLAFSRQQTLQPRVLNLTDVLGDLANLLRRLIGANIVLNMNHGRDLGLVRADQGQIEQVIINLAVNARDAMAEGGELSIRSYNETLRAPTRRGVEMLPAGDYVVLSVEDTGIGIPASNFEHIFEPFFTTKEVGAGTGLGLSTVYGIVKQTGGTVFVDSTPGEGTTFLIMLPRYVPRGDEQLAKPETSETRDAAETTGVGTVLVVEDEDAVRLFSARALRAKGYKVLEARTGEAALELLAVVEDEIDLLITDAVMPEMDGPTLIKEVRETMPDLRVICISGYAEETFRERLGQSTDIHFLPKPFSLAQLAGKVKEVMSLPKP